MKKFLNNFKRPELVWLLLILLVGGFFRFYQLGKIPPGTNVDEVAIGYNAYLIHKVGRDEWGQKYPLIFKSFGDYKPPGLFYSIAFLLNFLDLSTFVVRFPSAIAGFLSIIGIFLLAKEFFPKDKFLPLLGAAIFAFSPWSFNLSRLFFESNIALGFFIWALVFLFKFLEKQLNNSIKLLSKDIWIAIFLFSLSGYFYVAYRVASIILLFLAIVLLFWIKKIKFLHILLVFFIYGILNAPLIPQYFSGVAKQRLTQQNILINFGSELVINEKRGLCYLSSGKNSSLSKICYLFWNKPLLRVEGIFKSFVGHLSPEFLFFKGDDSPYDSPKGYGNFYLCFIPFYFLGLLAIFNQVFIEKKKKLTLLLADLVLSFLPSALVGAPSMHRANAMIPFLVVIILLGVELTFSFFKRKAMVNRIILIILLISFTAEASRYLVNYFWVYTKSNDPVWRLEIIPVMAYIKRYGNNYKQILFSNFHKDSIILDLAFYQKMDPNYFLRNIKRGPENKWGWVFISSLGKYQCGSYDLGELVDNFNLQKQGNILVVTTPKKNFSRFADKVIYDRYHSLRLAEIYDINNLYQKIKEESKINGDKK